MTNARRDFDKLVFGIQDSKVRERLLREKNLSLQKTDEICRAHETMIQQMKVVGGAGIGDTDPSDVNAFSKKPKREKKARRGRFPRGADSRVKTCDFCGRMHDVSKRENCPAFGKRCNKCNKQNHFANVCFGSAPKPSQRGSRVHYLEDEFSDEVFGVQEISAVTLDDSQLVTLKLESGNYLRFQPDTGAQCNVVPLHLYKKATNDFDLLNVAPVSTAIISYGGTSIPILGRVRLRVWRGDFRCLLDCNLVDSKRVRPILGRKACLGMKIVKFLDNDQLNHPQTSDGYVYAHDAPNVPVLSAAEPVLSADQLVKKFPRVFGDGVGKLSGEYHMELDETVKPVQHPPRRVPVAIRERLQEALEDLESREIVARVTTPTPWISSMVVVPKPNGTLRICLDPKDLNRALQRENYPLPTIEEVASRLHGAKVFTVLDVACGFWHVVLDEQSSFLTTFNTPFGRYRWKRMPFGIKSAPEIFQRKMHELIEGLTGVEVIADDFVVVGYGDSLQAASKDHDKSLSAFLQRCEERGVRLNADKLQLRMREVPFIGHVATSEGLRADPAKVRAIREMPRPENVAAVQRILGMVQYLSKFLPRLSDITKPLRDLTRQDVEWHWDEPQERAFEQLKEAVSVSPILRYYNLREKVTIQCDASQHGLGAVLLQGGQPVAYASRALTPTEENYAQIEKELLAIVFACEKFDAYIYGRDSVRVQTDHKPLESIFRKELCVAPKRLQRMLLRLQKYDLDVTYLKGELMLIADTLSRAHLPEVNASVSVRELEEVDHRVNLPLSDARWQQVTHASANDPVLKQLRDVIQDGWPERKSDVSECLRPYFDLRDELVVQDVLVFKGARLVVPTCMRKELMSVAHSTHIGIEGCLRRVRECLFWPRIASDVKDFVSKCDVCLAYRTSQTKEPLLQHEVISRPWAKLAADLCDFNGRTLLVVSDYFSGFIEVSRLRALTTQAVVRELKTIFARFGVPETLVTDNGSQFASREFKAFAESWSFNHITTSPRYPQSNGKAENAVKTVKRLFEKCKESGVSEFQALLDWRNTPTEGMATSPAQRLMGRRCRTLLPMSESLLRPSYPLRDDVRAMSDRKRRQKHYYDRHAKPLPNVSPGEIVRMRLPGQKVWTPATCLDSAGPRSFLVKSGSTVYRRNRRDIIKTGETPVSSQTVVPKETPLPNSSGTVSPGHTTVHVPSTLSSPVPSAEPPSFQPDVPPTDLRRSQRERRPPARFRDYVLT